MSKRALFIGRWQPFHNGHKWLIDRKLDSGIPILIAVRDIEPDTKNPFTTEQTIAMLESAYKGMNVLVISIPDIESVNYGRGVGYEINEFSPPADVGYISATNIRNQINNGIEDWKENVDDSIHHLVVNFLSENQLANEISNENSS